MSVCDFVIHDPVGRRFFATDLWCESEAREQFASLVRGCLFPISVDRAGLHLVEVPAEQAARFELLRWSVACSPVELVEDEGRTVVMVGTDVPRGVH